MTERRDSPPRASTRYLIDYGREIYKMMQQNGYQGTIWAEVLDRLEELQASPSAIEEPARHTAGRQRAADAKFLYAEAKNQEHSPDQRDTIEYMADLISKNTLVEAPRAVAAAPLHPALQGEWTPRRCLHLGVAEEIQQLCKLMNSMNARSDRG